MLIGGAGGHELIRSQRGALAARVLFGFIRAASVPVPTRLRQRLPKGVTGQWDLGRQCVLEASTTLTVVGCGDDAFRETSAARWIGASEVRRASLWPRTFRMFPIRLTSIPLVPLRVQLALAKNNRMGNESSCDESKSMDTRKSSRAARLALRGGVA